MAGEFTLTEDVPQQEPFALADTSITNPAPISPEVANTRSFKMKYGLDSILKQSQDEIFNKLTNGQEGELRTTAASEIDKRKMEQTPKVIQQVIGAKGGALTPAEALGLTQVISQMSEKTNPETVMETSYGKQFMATMDNAIDKNPSSDVARVRESNPEVIAKLQDDHAGVVSRREYAQTVAENIEADVKQQGWTGYLFDAAKSMVPGYTDFNERGNIPTVSVLAGGGLGPNLQKQRAELLGIQDFPTFKKKFDDIITSLQTGVAGGNPQLAADFARSMVGMSTRDEFLKSAVLPLDLAGLGIEKAAVSGVRKGMQAAGWIKQAEKAASDIAAAAADPAVSRSTVQAASGDLREAAVTRVVADKVGDPENVKATQNAIDALVETQKADDAFVRSNPGRRGQDIVNRILQASETVQTSFINAVENIQKINRLPDIFSNEMAVRAILDYTKDTYTGLANTVIHMSKPYREAVSNTFLTDMHLGNPDGTYFKNKQVAENFIDFHGLRSSQIVEGSDLAHTPTAVKSAKHDENIAGAQRIIDRNQAILDDKSATDAARAKAGEQVSTAEEYIVDQAMDRRALQQTVTTEQQGLGYYVKITKPIDETSSVIRSFLAETTNTKIPNSPIRQLINASPLGRFRTPEETLSLAERQNRLTATSAPSLYFKVMNDNAPTLNKILGGPRFGKGRKVKEEFQRILEEGQRKIDPEGDGKTPGYFYKSPQDLEEEYLRIHNRLPDDNEVVAYFEFKRGMEMDRSFRNIAEHRNQSRVGAETHTVFQTDKEGARTASPEFSGVTRKKFPSGDDNILIMGDKAGDERMIALRGVSSQEREAFDQSLLKGEGKVIELYAPEQHPLTGFAGLTESNRVRYVLAKDTEVRDLDWNQVARRGGGHMEYDYDHYIKQAKVVHDTIGNRHWYEGDTTIMPVQVRAMGAKVAEHLNQVRELIKAQNFDAARDYNNANLHIDWDTVHDWFISGHTDDGKYRPARLSLNEPIQVLKRGESIVNVDKSLEHRYEGFKNGQKEGSIGRQNVVEYNRERDAGELMTLDDKGTRGNPLYQVGQAKLVDPITTMNRGFARIAKSNFLDDYKTMSVEHWLKQAADYLDPTDSEIWHAPFYHFNNPKFKLNAPAEVRNALETARYHTQQLTGVPSTTDAWLHSVAQKTYDQLYERFGPKGLVIDPAWMLPKLKDPFAFIRGVTFNAKLGLFNVPQFIVQAGNYSNIYGIAGAKFATPGTLGAQLHFWSTVNSRPEIIDHLDRMASKLNVPGAAKWKEGEFKEAFQEMNKTGFGNVGQDYAVIDNPMSQKLVSSGTDKFLDWGQFFFKQGEKNARYGAWYTAFKEFRDANPVGRITQADRAGILQRADLLNINMSRASSSALHQGIWSLPTQFYTYQIRLMELFFGTRLTGVERARMMATNAAMYGIPMSAGLTGLPIADYLKNTALEHGYVVGENFWSTVLGDGLPAALGAVASGKGDIQKGTVYDVGSRFGTKGLEFLNVGSTGQDKGLLDYVGGASYSMAKSTWEASDGFRRSMWALVKGDPELYPATFEDGLDVAKEISIVKGISQSWVALRTGVWQSKKEAYLADNITPANALMNVLTGLKPQQITDINTMQNAIKDRASSERLAEKQFNQEFQRGLLELEAGNGERAQKYWNRARTILEWADYPEDRIRGMVNKATNNDQSLVDKTNFDFFIKRAPSDKQDAGLDVLQRKEEIRRKRGDK